jgi:hypothetical protein
MIAVLPHSACPMRPRLVHLPTPYPALPPATQPGLLAAQEAGQQVLGRAHDPEWSHSRGLPSAWHGLRWARPRLLPTGLILRAPAVLHALPPAFPNAVSLATHQHSTCASRPQPTRSATSPAPTPPPCAASASSRSQTAAATGGSGSRMPQTPGSGHDPTGPVGSWQTLCAACPLLPYGLPSAAGRRTAAALTSDLSTLFVIRPSTTHQQGISGGRRLRKL